MQTQPIQNMTEDANIIITTVSTHFDVDIDLMKSPSRIHETALARQTAMNLLKTKLPLSLKKVSLLFNKRDHTTVIHSMHVIEDYLFTDPKYRQRYHDIEIDLRVNHGIN